MYWAQCFATLTAALSACRMFMLFASLHTSTIFSIMNTCQKENNMLDFPSSSTQPKFWTLLKRITCISCRSLQVRHHCLGGWPPMLKGQKLPGLQRITTVLDYLTVPTSHAEPRTRRKGLGTDFVPLAFHQSPQIGSTARWGERRTQGGRGQSTCGIQGNTCIKCINYIQLLFAR